MDKIEITEIFTLGDSLSDRGTLVKRKLLGLIPMRLASGLTRYSPDGRFTNGYVWNDVFSGKLANQLIIDDLKRQGLDATDIADGIIHRDARMTAALRHDYRLDNNKGVRYKDRAFIQNYDEGGLTSGSYKKSITLDVKLFLTRLILTTLGHKRKLLLKDVRRQAYSPQDKRRALIIEWSGANDLITANQIPTIALANKAVKARMHNLEALIKAGFQHFVLFNMPDLSLTPKFKKKMPAQQQQSRIISEYFNQQLEDGVSAIKYRYPHCHIDVFDIYGVLTNVYEHPEQYGFDDDKLATPYIASGDFKINRNKTSPAKGYMFWDDVHPTANLHQMLAEEIYRWFLKKYNIAPPAHSPLDEEAKIAADASAHRNNRHGFFSTKASISHDSWCHTSCHPHRPSPE